MRRGLVERVVLHAHLDVALDVGTRDDRLDVLHHTEAVLELNRGALVEAEQVAQLGAEIVVPQVLVEAVRQVKVAGMHRQRQRGRQIDEAEIRLQRPQFLVVIVGRGSGCGSGGRLRVNRRDSRESECDEQRENGGQRVSGHNAALWSKGETSPKSLITMNETPSMITLHVSSYGLRYTTVPPTIVIATGICSMCFSTQVRISSGSTTRSASFPGSIEPLICSSKVR